MIRNAGAQLLALERKPISIVIMKVGGPEELTSKLYKVSVYNTDEHKIQVIQAVGNNTDLGGQPKWKFE